MTETTHTGFFGKFSFAVLIFSVVRGLIPLLTGSAVLAAPTYALSNFLGILLSLIGFYLALFRKSLVIPKTLRLLIVINFAFHMLWLLPILLLRRDINTIATGVIYTGLFPFSIFVLIKLPEKYLVKAFVAFTLLVSGTVMLDFIELNTFFVPDGIKLAAARHSLLRANFETFGHTDDVYRAVGIFGHRPHDAAVFLAILAIFWLQILVQTKGSKLLLSVLFFIAIIGLLMTQVASNILAFFVGVLFIAMANPRQFLRAVGVSFLPVILAIAAVLAYVTLKLNLPIDMLWGWQQRVSGDGDWTGMFKIDLSNPLSDLFSFFTGHGLSLELSNIGNTSEFAFVRLLMEYGIFHWIILMSVLAYPIWRYVAIRNESKLPALPYVGALAVGFISLWHYESVLHTTSIFLLFALYAQALRIFADAKLSYQPIRCIG